MSGVKKNYIFNLIAEVMLLVIPLIVTPYVSRVLTVNQVGNYSYSLGMVSYFVNFAVLGSSTFGQRKIASIKDDKVEVSNSFWNLLFFRLTMVIISSIGYFLYLYFTENLNSLCLVLFLNLVNVVFDISWFFKGIEQFKHVAIFNVIFKIINAVLVFVFITTPDDTWLYALIVSGITLLTSLSYYISLRKYITKPTNFRPFKDIKDIISIFLPTIAIEVYTLLDKTMLGWLLSKDEYLYEVGCYDRAEKIAKIPITVISSLSAVIISRVSNLFSNQKSKEIKSLIYKTYRFVLLLALPCVAGLAMISPYFIPVFLGDGYEKSVVLLQVLSCLILFIGLANVTGIGYLIATKQQNVYTVSVTISAMVNLVLNLIFIPTLKSFGAAVATISAELIGCVIQIAYCVFKKQLSLKPIFRKSWRYIIGTIVVFGYCLFISFILNQYYIWCFIAMIIGSLILYGCTLLLLRDDFVLEEIKEIRFKIHSNKIEA